MKMKTRISTVIAGVLVLGLAAATAEEKNSKEQPKRQTKQGTASSTPRRPAAPPASYGSTTGARKRSEAPSAQGESAARPATPFVIPPGFGPKPQPAAPAQPAKKAPRPQPAPSHAGAIQAPAEQTSEQTAPLKLPEGVKEIAPQTYSHTDAQGQKWIYRETPFGLRRFVDDGKQTQANTPSSSGREQVRITEEGDSLRFERSTPFGSRVWTKKKSELDEEEEAAWKASKKK
jgi:hypothetical protein